MSHVFISHRSIDKPRFRHFVLRLTDRRVPIWIDNYEQFNAGLAPNEPRMDAAMLSGGIRKAADWPTEIDVALLTASVVVLFWSRTWQADRAVLAREHGIALARHRANAAVYVPVYLDDPDDLPPALQKYRVDAGDLVQAFNVASFGQDHWTALLDTVEDAWRLRADIDRDTAAGGRIPLTGPADWKQILDRERTGGDAVLLLVRLPEGPAVDTFRVPAEIVRAFARGTDEVSAPQLVNQASRWVLSALTTAPTNPYAYVITPAELPAPDRSIATYWARVFDHACLLGPRMLAAVLLAAPPNLLRGVQADAAKLLETLEVWS